MNLPFTPRLDLREIEPNRWRITGGRPRLASDGEIPQAGWYRVTCTITEFGEVVSDLAGTSPIALRFLPASGDVPLARRPIPQLNRDKRTRVVFVPEGTERIELELSPWHEEVSIDHFAMHALSQGAAALIMSTDVAASATFGSTDRSRLVADVRSAFSGGGVRQVLEHVAVAYEHLQHRRAGDGVDYPSWRARNSILHDDDHSRLKHRLTDMIGGGPSISVVMPVYDPQDEHLRAAIASVQAQIHARWQLCMVSDASPREATRKILDDAANSDDRIIVRHRTTNGHIAATTNDALDMATGEFVAFMDHDDLLADFALAIVALETSNADLIYTDEDKIDSQGRHYDPHCKPIWNRELLLGQNYLSHLTAVRRSLLTEVGGLRPGFDGSQDHDLYLRVTAATTASRIRHVPFVAYHWRAVEGSTAREQSEKDYVEDASIAALTDHLDAGWTVGPASAPTTYRVRPPLDQLPLVSIIIPTRDGLELLEQCIKSLAKTTYPALEIIVVDNGTTDEATLGWMRAFDNGLDRRVVAAPGEFNFSRINNLGVEHARGDLICLLNNDTEVIEADWLTEMVRWVEQPGIGAVGAKLLYPDDTVQHAGVVLGLGGLAGHGHHRLGRDEFGYFSRLALVHEVGAVTAACLLTRRTSWDAVGGLDEELAVAFNDIDFCLRIRHDLGQRILWSPHALLYHHESVSRGAEDDPVKVARFNREVDLALGRWADVLSDDPAYSPNLTLQGDSFTLARQPRRTKPWDAPHGVKVEESDQ